MNDRIPGSSYDNPIRHGKWRIYLNDYVGPGDHTVAYAYVHDDYDPTPIYADDGPSDFRCGACSTVADCMFEIDCREAEERGDDWVACGTCNGEGHVERADAGPTTCEACAGQGGRWVANEVQS